MLMEVFFLKKKSLASQGTLWNMIALGQRHTTQENITQNVRCKMICPVSDPLDNSTLCELILTLGQGYDSSNIVSNRFCQSPWSTRISGMIYGRQYLSFVGANVE
jgi:hypothetical protein